MARLAVARDGHPVPIEFGFAIVPVGGEVGLTSKDDGQRAKEEEDNGFHNVPLGCGRMMRMTMRPAMMQTMAPKVTVNEALVALAIAPASRLPNGVSPRNASAYMPMTRPRSSSGTRVCTDVFAVAKKMIMKKPDPAKAAAESQ